MELAETTYSEAPKVDRDAGVIRDVKALGRTSKNGREYSDKALQDFIRLNEGAKVRFDHPPKSDPNRERQFIDSFGRIEKLRIAPDGVYGDMPFKKSHPYAPIVCESAERFPKEFGLSHNSVGSVSQKDGKTVVESLEKSRGVDVVDSPASTEGIFESTDSTDGCAIKFNGDDNLPPVIIREDMSADAPAGHDKKLKAAMEKMVMAIFRDDSIDSPTTAKKIGQSLKHYDKLLDLGSPGDGKPKEESGATAPEEEKPKQEEKPMAESTDPKPADPKPEAKPEMPSAGPDGQLTEAQFRFFMESVVAENNELKAALAKQTTERQAMEREVKARRLLESKGREANPFTEQGRRNVETLLKVESESLWTTLIDSWPQKSERPRPLRTGSVMESQVTGRRYHSPLDVHDGKSLVAAIFE